MEEPSSDFLKLRDYVDALDCRNLSAFSPENLRSGFSDKMVQQAREELKINKVKNDVETKVQGCSQDFSKGGVTDRDTIRGSPTIYGLYCCSPSCISGLSRIIAA